MPLNTLAAIKNGLRTPVATYKATAAATANGRFTSLWAIAGLPGAGATAPNFAAGSGYTCDSATAGAIPLVYPTGKQLYLAGIRTSLGGQAATVGGTLILYDRLWHCRGFNANSALLQSITTPGALPARDRLGTADGNQVEPFIEIYTAPGATPATLTFNYTNSAGTPTRSGTIPGFASGIAAANNLLPIALEEGDTGVRQVTGVQLSIGTGTAGDFGVTLMRRIAEVDITGLGEPEFADVFKLAKPRIYGGSCLTWVGVPAGVGTQIMQATLHTSQD
jgi:hypothetical protein